MHYHVSIGLCTTMLSGKLWTVQLYIKTHFFLLFRTEWCLVIREIHVLMLLLLLGPRPRWVWGAVLARQEHEMNFAPCLECTLTVALTSTFDIEQIALFSKIVL